MNSADPKMFSLYFLPVTILQFQAGQITATPGAGPIRGKLAIAHFPPPL
jgi:hypothetical protein